MAYMEDKDAGYFVDRMSSARSDAARQRVLDEWHRWASDCGDDYELMYWAYRAAAFRAEYHKAVADDWHRAYNAYKDTVQLQADTIKMQAETMKAQADVIAGLKVLFEDRFGERPWDRKPVAGFAGDLDKGKTEGDGENGEKREPDGR